MISDVQNEALFLGRTGRRTALLVGVVLLSGAVWAARIDLVSEVERNAAALDLLGTVYKLLPAIILVLLGKQLGSQSVLSLASLLALMTVGSLVIGTRWFNALSESVARPISDVVGRSPIFLKLATMFIVLVLVTGALIWKALREARPFERSAVVRLVALIALVGFFVGPVNALSTQGISRMLLFAEDFGQLVSLSALTGYGAGLLAVAGGQSNITATNLI